MTDSMIDYTTIFESTQNLPKNIVLGHGENADLVAAFTDNGVGVVLSGFTARAIYQPKSKWGTDEWFECPCDISGDTAVAHWGNLYDNGEDAVRMFLQLSKNGTVAYPGIYHIRLFETPGFAPSAIEPIPETIDFSEYILLNAPWALLNDFNTLSSAVSTLSSNIDSQLSTIVDGIPYSYRTIVAPETPGAGVIVDARNREVVGIVCDEGTTPNIQINPPAPVQGQVIDFVIDITNRTSADVRTLINFGTTWNPVLEEGEFLTSFSYITAGKTERLVFKQLGFPKNSAFPQLYLSRKYLTAS